MYTTEKFSPGCLLDSLDIGSEHEALEFADKVEASMHTWRRKCGTHSKSSWGVVKDLVSEIDRSDKNNVLAARAETLLFCLKQRYPELSQTTLDTSKIQYNQASLYLILVQINAHAMQCWTILITKNKPKSCLLYCPILCTKHELLFCRKKMLYEMKISFCLCTLLQDVGQAILESYSRVLEGLAFNIVAWIGDVLFVHKTMKKRD